MSIVAYGYALPEAGSISVYGYALAAPAAPSFIAFVDDPILIYIRMSTPIAIPGQSPDASFRLSKVGEYAGKIFGRVGPSATEDRLTILSFSFQIVAEVQLPGSTEFHVFGDGRTVKAWRNRLRAEPRDFRMFLPHTLWELPTGTLLSPDTVARGPQNYSKKDLPL